MSRPALPCSSLARSTPSSSASSPRNSVTSTKYYISVWWTTVSESLWKYVPIVRKSALSNPLKDLIGMSLTGSWSLSKTRPTMICLWPLRRNWTLSLGRTTNMSFWRARRTPISTWSTRGGNESRVPKSSISSGCSQLGALEPCRVPGPKASRNYLCLTLSNKYKKVK